MQAAKDAVKKFTSKDGKHDTTVHETVNPAVQHETIQQQQEERLHKAVDREVHQDHYHTSVQPVHDKEVLAEQHHHRAGEVEHRNFEHGDHEASRGLHAAEAAKFKDQSTRVQGESTRTAEPTIGAEHVHHHVHEQIQPVVHKQTIEPHVVHTTQRLHETHHNEAKHHQTSTLPAVGLSEFKSGGGILSGRGERVDGFEGCPKGSHESGVGSTGTTGTSGLASSTGTHGSTTGTHNHSHTGTGHTGTGAGVGAVGGAGASGAAMSGAQSAAGHAGQHEKPSMMDKLNPKKDADGDGKAGFMK